MPVRTGTAPLRNIDFSAVGKAGRRTGITLPQQRLDEHGLEEMSHLFSSPKKPSPLKTYLLAEPYEEDADNITPKPSKGSRRTPRASIPRSASPRKSGINGRAKRVSGLDIRSPKKAGPVDQFDGQENAPHTPPADTSKLSHRRLASSLTTVPLRDITPNGALVNRLQPEEESEAETVGGVALSIEGVHPRPRNSPQPRHATPIHQSLDRVQALEDDGDLILNDDNAGKAISEAAVLGEALAVSRIHRSKDTGESEQEADDKELDQVIERIKSRPNPPKSLYLLRRETPTDDTVTRTRSGRVSFKPLAYWRNERCIWGSSPSGNGIQDGARFPLNSIKEIIRTEEDEEDDQSSDSELEHDSADPHAEEWETERGTFHGNVAIWDSDLHQASKTEEEIEIAISRAAIEKTSIQHPSKAEPEFKYAKLLGNSFMGAGLVDLPPGGIKRTKNSKKMHMSFYVVKGRVTVTVGSILGDPNRFSIGKGSFWQVPRGNQYSIENDLDRPARIFFSQGCEVEVGLDVE
ncbi:hypothetical protein DV738_g4204, partial [Chaetothyriales sp. CBS 135597]